MATSGSVIIPWLIRLWWSGYLIFRRITSLVIVSISSALRSSITITGYLSIMGLSAWSVAAAHHRAPAS
jgi:hypothetical protein